MRLRIFLKYALYALVFWLVFAFQTAFISWFSVLDLRPDVFPVLVACTAVLENVFPAAFLGLWAGLLCDTASVSGIYFSLFYYFSAAFISRFCSRRFYPRPIVCLCAVFAVLLVSQGILYLLYYLPFFHAPASRFLRILLIETGFCLLVFYPLYKLLQRLHMLAPPHICRQKTKDAACSRIQRISFITSHVQEKLYEKQK